MPPPDEPDRPEAGQPGRLPRDADQLRAGISRISKANLDRNEKVRRESAVAVLADRMRRRRHLLVTRFRRMVEPAAVDEIARATLEDKPWGMTVNGLHGRLTRMQKIRCRDCKYHLEGLPAIGRCPECGLRYTTGRLELEQITAVLEEVLDLPKGVIRGDENVDLLIRTSCLEVLE